MAVEMMNSLIFGGERMACPSLLQCLLILSDQPHKFAGEAQIAGGWLGTGIPAEARS